MKKIFYLIAAFVFTAIAIVCNHLYVEDSVAQQKKAMLQLIDRTDIGASRYNWTKEQKDSFLNKEKLEIEKSNFCIYCSVKAIIE